LKRIQREVGITFVYVTHDQSEALTMSDRIAVMNKGRIEQLGTPAQIYETPATRFVAGFIGTSNILTGTAQRVSDTLVRIDYGGDQHVLANTPQQMSDSGLVITVRPEKIRLGKDV
ncbi:spermidine/putrescine ABC transporter ATP-binding protein, partial [Algoriphagus aestuarii]|nr:spermidine/putrescine ABC transporter ATP-binding protein [Algoriphagus aestuarii]